MEGFKYYCPKEGAQCSLRKHCFVLKTIKELDRPINLYQKCAAEGGKDIEITIGKKIS